MTERTHTPSVEVEQMLRDLAMPVCPCPADAAGQPCFRVVPGNGWLCSPCEQAWHGPGNLHGYAGAAPHLPLVAPERHGAQPPCPRLPVAAPTVTMAPCTVCERLTFFGVCAQHASGSGTARAKDGLFGGAGE